MSPPYGEQELARLERAAEAASVPALVGEVRRQQHDLDQLRLGLDVATRDREELRVALLAAQAEASALRSAARQLARLRRFVRERELEAELERFEGGAGG